MTFTPTPEQAAIVSFAQNSTENLAVIARAGAAKTSTLVLIAEALPKTDILCLAFNKKIATEMAERLPKNCEAKTLHGLGYKAWWGFTRQKMKVDSRKVYTLLSDRIKSLTDPDERNAAFESMSETLDYIATAKQNGYHPDEHSGHWRPLMHNDEFFASLPMEPSELQIDLIKAVCIDSFKLALSGTIDFDDMIFCPAICSVAWPSPTLTLIDEAQDLSPINHHILKKLVKKRRIIAVGDPCQAIYGFRGALADSMDLLIEQFSMTQLYLTISFRCAQAITENARWLAPDMRFPDWAKPGDVLRPEKWSESDIADGDAIICRNNAPLFSLAIKMIQLGRLPELAGKDLATPLKKIMKKLGKVTISRESALTALAAWEDNETKRARSGAYGAIKDRAQCIRVILRQTKTLGDAVAYLDHILARDGRIYLMTGHKSKGLEFDNVFFLNSWLCKIDKDQDANIKYVIETRAKERLIYVDGKTLELPPELEEADG